MTLWLNFIRNFFDIKINHFSSKFADIGTSQLLKIFGGNSPSTERGKPSQLKKPARERGRSPKMTQGRDPILHQGRSHWSG